MKQNININTIENLVQAMMTENTGINFMDSGGGTGRHWQQNQGKDFASMPAVIVDEEYLREGEVIEYTVNLYHALVNSFELDDLCLEFNENFRVMDDWDGIYGTSAEALDWLKKKLHLIDEDFEYTVNTCNHESALSQVVQYTVLGDYCLVQIHNGADVRGGYTDAKLMFMKDYLLSESIYGIVTMPDGEEHYVIENGYCLVYEDGLPILYEKGMKFDLYLTEF